MKYILTLLLVVASFASSANPVKKGEFIQKDNAYPMVKLTTTMGDIVVELDRRKAPITVNNFLGYVVDGGYEDTVFHRVEHDAEQERDFVIQGGGYDKK
jgi:peptidyl-prolyl cis-trans isomerase A (cyclophilin A)